MRVYFLGRNNDDRYDDGCIAGKENSLGGGKAEDGLGWAGLSV